jgi:hypothetical protein
MGDASSLWLQRLRFLNWWRGLWYALCGVCEHRRLLDPGAFGHDGCAIPPLHVQGCPLLLLLRDILENVQRRVEGRLVRVAYRSTRLHGAGGCLQLCGVLDVRGGVVRGIARRVTGRRMSIVVVAAWEGYIRCWARRASGISMHYGDWCCVYVWRRRIGGVWWSSIVHGSPRLKLFALAGVVVHRRAGLLVVKIRASPKCRCSGDRRRNIGQPLHV